MTEQKTEQQFIDDVQSVYRQSVEKIDAGTLARLNTIRNGALESTTGKSSHRIFYQVSAFAAVCLAVIIFTFVQPDSSPLPLKTDDIEILSTSDGLDFYENLEFYQWLEEYEISV